MGKKIRRNRPSTSKPAGGKKEAIARLLPKVPKFGLTGPECSLLLSMLEAVAVQGIQNRQAVAVLEARMIAFVQQHQPPAPPADKERPDAAAGKQT